MEKINKRFQKDFVNKSLDKNNLIMKNKKEKKNLKDNYKTLMQK